MIMREEMNMKDKKNKFHDWVRTHKMQLVLLGISISTITGLIIAAQNKDTLVELWDRLREAINTKSPVSTLTLPLDESSVPVVETTKTVRPYSLPTEAYNVSGHIRTMAAGKHHSAEKAAKAANLGITLSSNQTWVDSYVKYAS